MHYEDKRTSYTLTVLSLLPGQHSAPTGKLPEPTISPMGNREPKVVMQLPQHWRTLQRPLGSYLMKITGESAELKCWGSYRKNKVAWLTATVTQILADHIPACSEDWAEILDSGFAYLQSPASGPAWSGSLVGSSAWFGSLANVLYHPWNPFFSSSWLLSQSHQHRMYGHRCPMLWHMWNVF